MLTNSLPQLTDKIKQELGSQPIEAAMDRFGPSVQWHTKGREKVCLCPFHSDTHPSLTIYGDGAKWKCHACGAGGDAIDLVAQLKALDNAATIKFLANEFDIKEERKKPEIVETYIYSDPDGKPLYRALRWEPGFKGERKTFTQERYNSNGGWIGGQGCMKGVSVVPYRLKEMLASIERSETVFISEGEKDVHNLSSIGLAATTNHGGAGKWTAAHSMYFPSGTSIVILPDNDDPGRKHADSIAQQLHKRGCHVKIVNLPGLLNKGDVSDWLHSGHNKEELLQLTDKTPLWTMETQQAAVQEDDWTPAEWRNIYADTGYIVKNGRIYVDKMDREGRHYPDLLANFLVEPTKEISRDNGQEQIKEFEFRGLLEGRINLPKIVIPAEKFNALSWVTSEWGLRATIAAGANKKDKLREAIQSTARNLKAETIYTHLGWRKIDEQWVYLHAGGAIGNDNVTIDVGRDGLAKYILPTQTENYTDEALCSLKILDVAPKKVTFPLLCMVGLAPLCEAFRKAGHEPAFLAFVVGQTMSKKSTLTALFMSFFGTFSNTTLPANFKDTINAIERKGFACKDSILTVDDYHPTTSMLDANRMKAMAQALARTYGDRAARSRLSNDARTVLQAYVPRGLCIVTGEDIPDIGQSGTARYLHLELKRGEVNEDLLTEMQLNDDKLSLAMTGYIEYLSKIMDELPVKLQKAFIQFRKQAGEKCNFARLPEVTAWLFIGLSQFLEYLAYTKAITPERQEEILREGWETLTALSEQQAKQITQETPTVKFLTALRDMIDSGTALIDGNMSHDADYINEDCIGWDDTEYYYLSPGKSFSFVVEYYRRQESRFPVTAQTLWKQLYADGKIFVKKPRESFANLKKINFKNKRVLFLYRDTLEVKDD